MSKSKSIVVPDEAMMNKIWQVRGHKVMLDRYLAELYGVKAIRLREQVKRNIERFPENFMMQLTPGGGGHGIAKCDTIKAGTGRQPSVCVH